MKSLPCNTKALTVKLPHRPTNWFNTVIRRRTRRRRKKKEEEEGEEEESTEEEEEMEAMLEVEEEEEEEEDEDKKIRATLVDHVVNHGLTLREAGLRVQPNLSRYTVARGRPPMFTEQQEREIVNMVLANNAITLKQLQAKIVNNHASFNDIHQVVLPMDGEEILHEFIYVDEAGFNLTRTRRRGRNVIGHRPIVNVPGQRGGNITLYAAITQNGVLHRHAHMGPYNTALILTFLDQLHNIAAANQIDHMQYIVVWDNVSFHRSALVQNWFQQHPHFTVLYLPPYSPFLNPIEEFFAAWRWNVYDLRLQAEVPLIQAMEEAWDQMEVAAIQGWIRHSRCFFPRCLANDNIACDADEIL
ncbi:hypothetical protein M9458_057068 [Cirrhinus mrigala]|uniref:Tc1-like transposase DDE domain-containing protein n=1 Tax=Cirrhinus mrigala TaxID=683832 RepID=A0ABD0MFU7_CIRMR